MLTFRVFFVVTGGAVGFYNILIIPIATVFYLKSLSPSVQKPLTLIFHQLGRFLAMIFRVFYRIIRLLWLVILLPFRGLWWLAHTCLRVAYVLLRLLWLPEKLLLQWLWRSLREECRKLNHWLRQTLPRILHRK